MKTEFFIKQKGWVSFCWFWGKFSKERSFIFNRCLHASLQETAVLCALIRDLMLSGYLAVPAVIGSTWRWVTSTRSVSQLRARPATPEPAESLHWGSCPYKIFQTHFPRQGEFLCSILHHVLAAFVF